jgi:opacity protein-like surface antigen
MNTIRIRKSALLGSSALAVALMTSSGAFAQSCTDFNTSIGNLSAFGGFAAAASSSITSSVANINTAFLTQQGSAFVANPGGAAPDTQGGGVWARGVGGQVDVKSASVSNVTFAAPGALGGPVVESGTVTCASKQRQDFGGVQVGADIARLNWEGWNVNIGTTAGYLESRNKERLSSPAFASLPRTNFEVPFAGTYIVVTRGGFFADLTVRTEFYNIELDNPGANFFNQSFSAHGVSVLASAGYQFQLQNNWFIEPSAGFIWSKAKVDPFSAVGLPGGREFSGTIAVQDIDSQLGRASLRVGTSFQTGNVVLQPFVTASVFHEFADDVQSSFQTCAGCVFLNQFDGAGNLLRSSPASINVQTATTRIGTYGQFSAGVAGQVLNTGWVGFVRGDYRTGDNIEGWTANAGLRYNFLPEAPPPPVIAKAPAPAIPVAAPVYWGGFYVGGFFGADFGRSRVTFDDFTTTRPRTGGPIGGGQVGYNWQFGRVVAGIEGDIGAANIHGARTCGFRTGLNAFGVPSTFSPFFLNCENEMDWVATVTGKIGMTWDRALIYVKGGAAFTEVDTNVTCIVGPNNTTVRGRGCFNSANVFTNGFSASDDRIGGTIGFGSEFMLNTNWSAKTELNYTAFGKDTVRADDGTLLRVNNNLVDVKVGVNYHFNPWLPR